MLVSTQSQHTKTTIAILLWSMVMAMFGLASMERVASSLGLKISFISAALVLGLNALIQWFSSKKLSVEFRIRKPHLVQATVQFGVFVYWGTMWDKVYEQAPLIVAQIIFAYGCEAYFSLRRYSHWRFGLGPIPIVLSTNLFLWFVDDFFAFQFVLILLAYASRDLLVRTAQGIRSHLFNPSAFALSLAAICLIVFRIPEVTHGANIAESLGRPEYAYQWIFLMGFIVQGFFRVTVVTMSAAITMVGLGTIYTAVFGTYYYVDTAIPIAVFLGMNLLITDPATSPRTILGRVIFGALYGLSVFVTYELLRNLELSADGTYAQMNISWIDKLLCVPLLNLLSRPIDALVHRCSNGFGTPRFMVSNLTHMGLWLAIFASVLPDLNAHAGRKVTYWEDACTTQRRWACQNRERLYLARCASGDAKACFNYAVDIEQKFSDSDQGFEQAHISRALDGYRRACSGKLARACVAIGGLCTRHPKACGTQEVQQATILSCEYGEPSGCEQLVRYVFAEQTPQFDLDTIAQNLSRGCNQDKVHGCRALVELGQRILLTEEKSVFGTAHRAFSQACQASVEKACINLSIMELRGDGVPKSVSTAAARLKALCSKESQTACDLVRKLNNENGSK